MCEVNNSTQILRFSIPAVVSLVLGLIGFLIFILTFHIYTFPDRLHLIYIIGFIGFAGFISGMVKIIEISRLATVTVILAVIILSIEIVMSNPVIHLGYHRLYMKIMTLVGMLFMILAQGVFIYVSIAKKALVHGMITSLGILLNSFLFLVWLGEIKYTYWEYFRKLHM